MKTLTPTPAVDGLDRLLDPLTDCLTPAMARRIVSFRADRATKARIQELADKCNEGELTSDEHRQYESFVRAIHLISVLQSKARRALVKARKS